MHQRDEEKTAAEPPDEACLRAVMDTAVDGIILISGMGIIRTFNPACERLFGYRADEAIGRNVKMLMPSPVREEHDHYMATYRRTGQRNIVGIGREVTGQRKDGTCFPMHLSVGETVQNGETIFVGIMHDLTVRKRIEEQLA